MKVVVKGLGKNELAGIITDVLIHFKMLLPSEQRENSDIGNISQDSPRYIPVTFQENQDEIDLTRLMVHYGQDAATKVQAIIREKRGKAIPPDSPPISPRRLVAVKSQEHYVPARPSVIRRPNSWCEPAKQDQISQTASTLVFSRQKSESEVHSLSKLSRKPKI